MLTYILILVGIVGIAVLKATLSSPNRIGKSGERRVARKLDWLSEEYIVLNDIMLPTQYGTTQIDHVVISPYGIFVIETKNYKGWIFGHENSEEWKQSLLGKKKWYGWSSEQYKFRNPIRQNKAHTIAIKSLLSEFGDFKVIPIVVFSDHADLKITAPNYLVVNWCDLRSVIKQYIAPCISENSIKAIISKIDSANIKEDEKRQAHVTSVQRNLIQREHAIENRICPKCGAALVERHGRYGKFLGCSSYPKCTFTVNLD